MFRKSDRSQILAYLALIFTSSFLSWPIQAENASLVQSADQRRVSLDGASNIDSVSPAELKAYLELQSVFEAITLGFENELARRGEHPNGISAHQQKYEDEMTRAVDNSSLSLERYGEIQDMIFADPRLQRRFWTSTSI